MKRKVWKLLGIRMLIASVLLTNFGSICMIKAETTDATEEDYDSESDESSEYKAEEEEPDYDAILRERLSSLTKKEFIDIYYNYANFYSLEKKIVDDPEDCFWNNEYDYWDVMYDSWSKKASNQNGFLIYEGMLLDYKGDDTEIRIPDNVTEVVGFNPKNVKKIIIPSNVTYMANSFCNGKIEKVNFEKRHGEKLVLFNGCFNQLKNMKKLILPDNVMVGDMTFWSMGNQFKLVLPKNITKIGNDCFVNSGTIKVSKNLKKIGTGSFKNTNIVCPKGTYIEKFCQKNDIDIYRKLTPYFRKNTMYVVKGYEDSLNFYDMGIKPSKRFSTNSKIVKVKKTSYGDYVIKGMKEGIVKIKVIVDGKTYTCTVKVLKKTKKNRIKQAIQNVIFPGMDAATKADQLGFWLHSQVKYDEKYYVEGISSTKYKPWTSEGALIGRYAICQGFAESYKEIAQTAGMKCTIKGGTLDGEAHAWNLVKINGKWANIDVTNAFGIGSDKQFSKTFSWNKKWYPKATFEGKGYLIYH